MYESSTKETSGCASNLLAHEDLGQFEEAHYWNIQAKLYIVKFPLMKVTTYETLYMKNMVLLWSTIYETRYIMVLLWSTSVEKKIVALPLFCLLFFFGLSLLFLGQCSIEWWSSHFYLFTTQWLQLDSKTKYDSIWMPPAVYRDMQWIKSDKYEEIMNGGFATNTMSTTWSC